MQAMLARENTNKTPLLRVVTNYEWTKTGKM